MKFEFIGNASGIFYGDKGTKLLCDPWIVNGVFDGSWCHYPPLLTKIEDLLDVDWQTHQKWFKSKLNDKNSFLYVAESNQAKIGQVRFDCKNNKATINYSIFSDFRGFGFGKKIVLNSIKQIKKDYLDLEIIEAKVKKIISHLSRNAPLSPCQKLSGDKVISPI